MLLKPNLIINVLVIYLIKSSSSKCTFYPPHWEMNSVTVPLSHNKATVWIKPEKSMNYTIFQLILDNILTPFTPSFVLEDKYKIEGVHYKTDVWNELKFDIEKYRISWKPDPIRFIIHLRDNYHDFLTNKWYRSHAVQAVKIKVEGLAEIAVGCSAKDISKRRKKDNNLGRRLFSNIHSF